MADLSPIQLHDTEETSRIVHRSTWALIADRKYGRGIPYIKVGRSVRYSSRDIEEYINAHRVIPGEPQAARPVKKAPAPVQDVRAIPPHLRGMRGFR